MLFLMELHITLFADVFVFYRIWMMLSIMSQFLGFSKTADIAGLAVQIVIKSIVRCKFSFFYKFHYWISSCTYEFEYVKFISMRNQLLFRGEIGNWLSAVSKEFCVAKFFFVNCQIPASWKIQFGLAQISFEVFRIHDMSLQCFN